ncbi:MAG TPA: PVC-type heme-binding CxxCH protein [Gemmataceae bacterium]|nr:PVC-type heme-binding CxxCH protein [Gemmataceae bacterium]
MRFAVLCVSTFLLVCATVWLGSTAYGQQDPYGDFIARSKPLTPAEEQKRFHLPPGFEIELVASEPAIIKPINMNFDDRGRLWVTQSIEYPFPAPPSRKARDTIKILEDTKGDGVADKITTFADGLNIPIGILPVPHGAIVYSIPKIYRVLDSNGKGKADRREELYGTFGFADTHGMASSFTWGFDGWIYACHGFSNTSKLKGKDGATVKMQSGNAYRIRPDGSHIEQFTHGQVNPFGLCFDPLGNLYSADCHTRPVMMLLRGAYYQSFGKPDDGLGFAPEMCDHDHGSTAIAGIVYYAANHFPPEYLNTVFIGNVVTNRINHDHLERHGSTYKAIEQPDFLSCDDPWFRPVDLKLGTDGALYVADFYNRIIGHYEVPLTHPGRDHERGRIWRIVYRGPNHQGRPVQPRADWGKATVAELVSDLAHPNLVVRMKATNQLVERGGEDVLSAVQHVMNQRENAIPRMHGLWILERLHALDDKTLEAAGHDQASGVRVHAMRVLAERPHLAAALQKLAQDALKDADPFVQRCAADALGTHASADNVAPLLALRHVVPADDTHLLYTVRVALRNQLLPVDTWPRLPVASWSEQDARAIADVAAGAPTPEAARYLLTHLQRGLEPGRDNQVRYAHHVARYGADDAVQALLVLGRDGGHADLRTRAAFMKALLQGNQERGGKLSNEAAKWAAQVTARLLDAKELDLMLTGSELAGSLQIKSEQPALAALAKRRDLPEAQRRGALDALVAMDAKGNIGLFSHVLEDSAEPMGLREHLAGVLGGLNQPDAHAELLKTLAIAPAQLQSAIAVALAGSSQGAAQLLDAVAAGKASARLLQEWPVHVRLDKQSNLKDRLAKLTQGLPAADQRLQELLQRRRKGFVAAKGDPIAGARIFEKSCAICHQIAGKGAKVGPQLDGVGNRGLDRLLEDVIDPNRNIDQAFRSTMLLLKNGQTVSGLVLREEGEVLVLADAQGKDVRVPKNTVEERTVSQLSPMPANLVDQIAEPDFYHLLAYLLAQRPPQTTKATR